MSSSVTLSSENRPPWRTRYFSPTSVASGRAEKLSEKSLNTLRKDGQYDPYIVKYRHWLQVVVTPRGDHVPLVVFGFALSLEAVDAVHVVCLMIATVEEETIWPQPFVGIQ